MNVRIKMLYEMGPLEFWLYSAEPSDHIVGPAVYGDNGNRIGQLVVHLKGKQPPATAGIRMVDAERDGDTWTIHETGLS